MVRLANISGKEAVKAFAKAGWQVMGQVGSHVVMTKQISAPISLYANTRNSPPERHEH